MWQTHNIQFANFDVASFACFLRLVRALCVAYERSISC
jgi:hypothetical protein